MGIVSSSRVSEGDAPESVSRFMREFRVAGLLRRCGCAKERGVPAAALFLYALCNVFRPLSVWMQLRGGVFPDGFSKNAYYRFLCSARANWLRFTTLLSERVVNARLRPLTGEAGRCDCLVVDDTLYERTGWRRTELASRVFDHVGMRYAAGYRLMTLGWTDGRTFVPVSSCLLASGRDSNLLGPAPASADMRTVAGRRRAMARSKGTDVMAGLLREALAAGHTARWVLFDSWFANPSQLLQVKDMGLDAIAMLKKGGKTTFEHQGRRMNLQEIYRANRKRRGRSRYLLSVDVTVPDPRGGEGAPARIVYYRNRADRKQWVALVTTDTTLDEDEVRRIYGKRWDIEVFFKTCKSHLRLTTECHSLSYDALTAHVAIVLTRYMILALAERDQTDPRTIGELFYLMCAEMDDITLDRAISLITQAMANAAKDTFHADAAQMEEFTNEFLKHLPEDLRQPLMESLHKNN